MRFTVPMTHSLPFPSRTPSSTENDHEAEVPRIDARAISHAVRHAAVFGALDSMRPGFAMDLRSEEHTSELQSRGHLVCRLLLEKKKTKELESSIPAGRDVQ